MMRFISIFASTLIISQLSYCAIHYATPSGSGNAMSWGTAGNLHTALNSASSGDEIWIASGNHYPSITDQTISYIVSENIHLYGGFSGSESNRTDRDWINNPTILSGEIQGDSDNTNNTDTIVLISGNFITLSGLIIENGNGASGAGIYGYSVSGIIIEHCILNNNEASSSGGGAYLYNSTVSLAPNTVRDSIFDSNKAVYDAGGLYFHSNNNGSNNDEIYNVIFYNNVGDRGAAGLLYASSGPAYNLTFLDNRDNGSFGDNCGQLAITSANSSGNIYNIIFAGANNTVDIASWKNDADTPITFMNSHVEYTNIAQIGTGNTSKAILDGSTSNGVFNDFVDISNPRGPDGIWLTSDDGLMLQGNALGIDSGISQSPYTDKDILGLTRTGNPDIGAYEYISIINGPDLTSYTGYSPPAELITYQNNESVLSFNLDTQNTGFSGNINEIIFNVTSADPSIELTGALINDLTSGNFISNSPTFSSSNISFTSLNYPINSSANLALKLKINTASTFTGSNINFTINGTDIKFDNGATAMGPPISSGNIPLRIPFEGLSFGAGNGTEPVSFTQGDNNIMLIDMDFNLANSSTFELIERIKISFQEGIVGTDIDKFEIWESGNKLGELNSIGSNFASNTMLDIPIIGPTNLEVRADILSGASSGNLQYTVNGSTIIIAGGNSLVQPTVGISNLGPINPPTPSTYLNYISQLPLNGANNISLSDNLVITFEENLTALGTGNVEIYRDNSLENSYNSASGELSVIGSSLTINPGSDLISGSNYHIIISSNMITGTSGNSFNGFHSNTDWAFSTNITGNTNLLPTQSRLSIGQHTIYALLPSGNLSAEGENNHFQIDSSFGPQVSGGPEFGPENIDSIAAGAEHLLILKAGQVYATGSDDFNNSQGFITLTPISGINNIDIIEAGSYSSYAYDSNSNILYVWGKNNSGQLANGTTSAVTTPTSISKPAGIIESLAAGVDHLLAVINGDLYGAGSDKFGQLAGIGSTTSLTLIDNSETWISVGVGGFHSFAINTSGNLFTFGKNHKAQLGLGYSSPYQNNLTELNNLSNVKSACGGYAHSLVLLNNGQIMSVGSNHHGQTGDNIIKHTINWINVGGYSDVTQISCGPYTSIFINDNNTNEFIRYFGRTSSGPQRNIILFKTNPSPSP